MLWTLVALFLVLAVAGAVVLYVAFPHRGEELPYAPALGERVRQAKESIPTLDQDEVREYLQQRR